MEQLSVKDGDTASDTSLIEPADKKWLMELVEKCKAESSGDDLPE